MANELQTKLDAILEDKNTNLLPEHLKAGVTCLGVEGKNRQTIKKFNTAEDMQKDDDIYENDIAIIYQPETRNPYKKDVFTSIVIPQSFTLSAEEIPTEWSCSWFFPIDPEASFDDMSRISLDESFADISYFSSDTDTHFQIFFEGIANEDGSITYTLGDGTPGEYQLGRACQLRNDIQLENSGRGPWHDSILKMFKINTGKYEGLYSCDKVTDTTKVLLADLSAVSFAENGKPVVDIFNGEVLDYEMAMKCIEAAKTYNTAYSTIIKIKGKYYSTRLTRVATSGSSYGGVPQLTKYQDKFYLGYCLSAALSSGTLYMIEVDPHLGTCAGVETSVNGIITSWSGTNQDVLFDVEGLESPALWVTYNPPTTVVYNLDVARDTYNYESYTTSWGNKLSWEPLKTQFNIIDKSQILPEYMALGYTGAITGDGSIYDKLDPIYFAENVFGLSKYTLGGYSYYGDINQQAVSNTGFDTNKLTHLKINAEGSDLFGHITRYTTSWYDNWKSENSWKYTKLMRNGDVYMAYGAKMTDSTNYIFDGFVVVGTKDEITRTITYHNRSSITPQCDLIDGKMFFYNMEDEQGYIQCYDPVTDEIKNVYTLPSDITTKAKLSLSMQAIGQEYLYIATGGREDTTSSATQYSEIAVYDVINDKLLPKITYTQNRTSMKAPTAIIMPTPQSIYYGAMTNSSSSSSEYTYLNRYDRTSGETTVCINAVPISTCKASSYASIKSKDGRYQIGIETDQVVQFEGYATSIEFNKSTNIFTNTSAGAGYMLFPYQLFMFGDLILGRDRNVLEHSKFYIPNIEGTTISTDKEYKMVSGTMRFTYPHIECDPQSCYFTEIDNGWHVSDDNNMSSVDLYKCVKSNACDSDICFTQGYRPEGGTDYMAPAIIRSTITTYQNTVSPVEYEEINTMAEDILGGVE